MQRNATAQWQGGLKQGEGSLSTDSGELSTTPYSFATRFEKDRGTNPEELIGAAHAGCFSMALAMILGEYGLTAERIDTEASVSLNEADGGYVIDAIHLEVSAKVPDTDADSFRMAAEQAKKNCPVSKLLNADITMNAQLEG